MLHGAQGFLLKPFSETELIGSIRQAYDLVAERRAKLGAVPMLAAGPAASAPARAKIVTVYSPKGGVGCTTIAANLAVALHKIAGQAVTLVDADLRFGDIEDPDFPETLPLLRARSAVSTIPNTDLNLGLLAALRRHGFAGPIAMTAHRAQDRRRLAAAGVERILEPFADAADFAARAIAQRIAS